MENHIEEIEPSSKRDKGFTLVELLIVIVILGILATVTVFAVRGITDKGQTSACSADRKTLEVGAEAYFAQYGGATILIDTVTPFDDLAIPGSSPARFAGPDAETTLKNAGFLRNVSPKYEMGTDGKVKFNATGDQSCLTAYNGTSPAPSPLGVAGSAIPGQ